MLVLVLGMQNRIPFDNGRQNSAAVIALIACQSWMSGFVLSVRNMRAFDEGRKLSAGLQVERRTLKFRYRS